MICSRIIEGAEPILGADETRARTNLRPVPGGTSNVMTTGKGQRRHLVIDAHRSNSQGRRRDHRWSSPAHASGERPQWNAEPRAARPSFPAVPFRTRLRCLHGLPFRMVSIRPVHENDRTDVEIRARLSRLRLRDARTGTGISARGAVESNSSFNVGGVTKLKFYSRCALRGTSSPSGCVGVVALRRDTIAPVKSKLKSHPPLSSFATTGG